MHQIIAAETKGTALAARSAALENAHTARARTMAQGNMVDHQCNALINNKPLGMLTSLPCRGDHLRARVALLRRLGKDPTTIPVLGIHPLVWKFLFFMDKTGFLPVAAQIGVVDHDTGVGTMCDQVWQHRNSGFLVLVELKKWESVNYEVATGRMQPPYHRALNHHRNQHQLQLAYSLHMLEKTFRFRMRAAYVVRLHAFGVEVYPLEEWASSQRILTHALTKVRAYLAPLRAAARLGNPTRETVCDQTDQTDQTDQKDGVAEEEVSTANAYQSVFRYDPGDSEFEPSEDVHLETPHEFKRDHPTPVLATRSGTRPVATHSSRSRRRVNAREDPYGARAVAQLRRLMRP
jgi:hypothetical protein